MVAGYMLEGTFQDWGAFLVRESGNSGSDVGRRLCRNTSGPCCPPPKPTCAGAPPPSPAPSRWRRFTATNDPRPAGWRFGPMIARIGRAGTLQIGGAIAVVGILFWSTLPSHARCSPVRRLSPVWVWARRTSRLKSSKPPTQPPACPRVSPFPSSRRWASSPFSAVRSPSGFSGERFGFRLTVLGAGDLPARARPDRRHACCAGSSAGEAGCAKRVAAGG